MQVLRARNPFSYSQTGDETNQRSGVLQRPQHRSQSVPVLASANAKDRLDSWKEIATHLKRTVRTVQRWERHEGLPIHRHLHRRANSVYAHKTELDEWWDREARSIEVKRIQTISQGVPRAVAGPKEVKANHSEKGDLQTVLERSELFIECVLEPRTLGPCSSRDAVGRSASVYRIRIPVSGVLRPREVGGTTREVNPHSRSLSLAGFLVLALPFASGAENSERIFWRN